jgi:hypothetical protein
MDFCILLVSCFGLVGASTRNVKWGSRLFWSPPFGLVIAFRRSVTIKNIAAKFSTECCLVG